MHDEEADMMPSEVAAKLSVNRETVKRWLRQGGVFPHAYQLPGRHDHWRIPRADVDALRTGRRDRNDEGSS